MVFWWCFWMVEYLIPLVQHTSMLVCGGNTGLRFDMSSFRSGCWRLWNPGEDQWSHGQWWEQAFPGHQVYGYFVAVWEDSLIKQYPNIGLLRKDRFQSLMFQNQAHCHSGRPLPRPKEPWGSWRVAHPHPRAIRCEEALLTTIATAVKIW